MASVNDDLDIRAALADLTEDQPPARPGRLAAIRRRARIQRRRRIVASAVAAVAAVAVAVSLAALPRAAGQPPLARHVPRWALPWPDHRNGSVPKSVLDRAVLAWLYQYQMGLRDDGGNRTFPAAGSSDRRVAELAGTYPIVWYVGQTIDHGSEVVVTFEADPPTGPQLVVGQAAAAAVMHNQPAWSNRGGSPWNLLVGKAPNPRKPPVAIGQYVTVPAPVAATNWVVLLTAPDVRSVHWFEATTSGVRRPSVRTQDGLVVADAGRLTSQVELTGLSTGRGFVSLRDVPIGIPGQRGAAVPDLASPPAPTVPGSLTFVAGWAAQGDQQDEDSSFAPGRGQYAFLATCYGPQRLRLTVNGHAVGTISCDGQQQQQLRVPRSALHGHGIMFGIDTSELTSWQVDFVHVQRP
jgi:hypothetical protein